MKTERSIIDESKEKEKAVLKTIKLPIGHRLINRNGTYYLTTTIYNKDRNEAVKAVVAEGDIYDIAVYIENLNQQEYSYKTA